jgi:hypothetical protein
MKRLAKLLSLAALLAVLGMAGTAHAQYWGGGKAGPVELNFKFGPAIGVSDASTQFSLQFELGFAVTGNRNGYLIFPFTLQVGNGETVIHVPIGFQYDFPVGPRGLYIYPRFAVGFSADHVNGTDGTAVGIMFAPGFGIKYVLRGRFNFIFEPFNLPIGVYFNTVPDTLVSIWYTINFGFGFNF